jgi:hypothetical protein
VQREAVPVASVTLPARRGAPVVVAGAVAAAWAGMLSFLPVLALTLLAGVGSGAAPANLVRDAGVVWLLAHGVPVTLGSARITLVPLALSALAGWRVWRAGVHANRAGGGERSRSRRRALEVGLSVGLTYALLASVVAALVTPAGVGVSTARTAATTGLFAAVLAGLGAVSRSRSWRRLGRRVPPTVYGMARIGGAASLLILGAGAAAIGAALAVRVGDARDLLGSYHAGVAGQAGLTLVCVAYGPNLAIWAAAYLLGPGFALGVGTTVSPAMVALGPVPALPVLAALPRSPATGLGVLLLGIPLLAAMAAGVVASRTVISDPTWSAVAPGEERLGTGERGLAAASDPTGTGAPSVEAGSGSGWPRLLGSAVLAGPFAGVILTIAAATSGGSAGSGRLTTLGPSPWSVGLWGMLLVGVGAPVGAALGRALRRWPRRQG